MKVRQGCIANYCSHHHQQVNVIQGLLQLGGMLEVNLLPNLPLQVMLKWQALYAAGSNWLMPPMHLLVQSVAQGVAVARLSQHQHRWGAAAMAPRLEEEGAAATEYQTSSPYCRLVQDRTQLG